MIRIRLIAEEAGMDSDFHVPAAAFFENLTAPDPSDFAGP
jgi:hypothetical protein